MKTKLVLSTNRKDFEYWFELPFIPHINEWFNVKDVLTPTDVELIKNDAVCWSGVRGQIESVEYRKTENAYYSEVIVWCED